MAYRFDSGSRHHIEVSSSFQAVQRSPGKPRFPSEERGFVVSGPLSQGRSWAKVALSAPIGEIKPIKVEGDPWTALLLHHDAFSTMQFTKVVFYINGGVDGGQVLTVKAYADGKALDSNYVIQPKAKTWSMAEIPLKELGADNKTIDGLCLQAQGTAYKPYYITRIQLE